MNLAAGEQANCERCPTRRTGTPDGVTGRRYGRNADLLQLHKRLVPATDPAAPLIINFKNSGAKVTRSVERIRT